MKKSLFCICLFLLLFTLCACGKGQDAGEATEYSLNAEELLNNEEVKHHDCEVHGHVLSVATCQKPATCYYCGRTNGKLGAHDYLHATCLQQGVCTVCGDVNGKYGEHLFTKASCAAPAACAVCGIQSGSTLSHNFRAATCSAPAMCTGCMQKSGSPLGHIWSKGSCTEGRKCSRCGQQETPKGHQMKGGSCTEDAVCTECKYREKAKGHQFDGTVCTVCGKTREQATKDEATQTKPADETTPDETTTQKELDKEKLQGYSDQLTALLTQAHDDADKAIDATYDEGRELGSSALDCLKQCMTVIEEAKAVCAEDARLKTASDQLSNVEKAIRKSAAVQGLYDSSFLNTMVTVRADSANGLTALKAYTKTISAL